MDLEKLSFGVGDRFAYQAATQSRALAKARGPGVDVVSVWKKSNREHTLCWLGTEQRDCRSEGCGRSRELAAWLAC
jgi:hypothetical protein